MAGDDVAMVIAGKKAEVYHSGIRKVLERVNHSSIWVGWSNNLGLATVRQAGSEVKQFRFSNRHQAGKYRSQGTEYRKDGIQAQEHPELTRSISLPKLQQTFKPRGECGVLESDS